MADIINLNKARKQKARKEAAALADANRVKFGRTKAQKTLDLAQAQEAQRKLDGLKRESGDMEPDATKA